MSGFVYSLRKFHGRLYNNRINLNNKLIWWKYITFPLGKKVYFIGTPNHTNIGDSAIAISEMFFLEKCGFDRNKIKEFTQFEFKKNYKGICKLIRNNYLICGIGGGNLGNQWYDEELFRQSFLDAFPDNPTIIFPQTVYFTPDDTGRKALDNSYSHYNNHKNLTIVAREQKSFDLLNQYYSTPKKMLTPDIVLSSTMDDYGVESTKRQGVLLLFRGDEEKSMSDNDRSEIISILKSLGIQYKITDMHSECQITKNNRLKIVKDKMQQFVSSELVITDRLHGMVFAAITGTPCIVFSNYNHKVQGTYDWIDYLSYIKYVDNIDEATKLIPKLLNMKNCKYDNKPLLPYFDELAEVVKHYVN